MARRRATLGTFVGLGLAVALVFAFFVSPHASSSPDGLERVAIDTGFDDEATDHALADRPLAHDRVTRFADEGPSMAALVQRLIRQRQGERSAAAPRHAREHLLRVVGAFRAHGAPGGDTQGVVEPLTARELEVLDLLAAGRPNRDIADELVVTLDTVKRHVSHIFDKLGVFNRTEAVVKARELHLIR